MQDGTGSLLRLLLGAVLTVGGLAAIAIGVAMMIAPSGGQACRIPVSCMSVPVTPAVADRARRSATD